ncbi:MAG: hypothetical protein IKK38_05895 [Spirochaetaceae bacterium]|nr:hypothetical protein [Spirochaetaceae bacterium]
MTEFIAHRINTIAELKVLPSEYGVELDLRDDLTGRIYIQHNPFEDGEDFEPYAKEYSKNHNGTMILNVKSERIEHKILEVIKKYGIKNYFFLDSTFPMIKLLSDMGEKGIALRFSEFEGMDTVRAVAGKIGWIWVDTFTKLPIDKNIFDEMKKLGYMLCLVSPELQGQPEKIPVYKEQLAKDGIVFDAICTKSYNIEKWR